MAGQFPQHADTFQRNFSDEFKVPTHYDFLGSIEKDIEDNMKVSPFIEITDQEVVDKRVDSGHTLTYGDALEVILKDKCGAYEGLVFWKAVQSLGLEIENEGDNNLPSPRRIRAIERQIEESNVQVKFQVREALYSTKRQAMYYFYE